MSGDPYYEKWRTVKFQLEAALWNIKILNKDISRLETALREIQSITSAPDVYSLSHEIASRALSKVAEETSVERKA